MTRARQIYVAFAVFCLIIGVGLLLGTLAYLVTR